MSSAASPIYTGGGVIEIPNGTVASLICDVTVPGGGIFGTADAAIAAIGNELIGDGLTISSYSVNLSGLFFGFTGEFSATLQIYNQSGQELDDRDLVSQFTEAVQSLGGTVVSAGVSGVTGAPGNANNSAGGVTPVGTAAGQTPPGSPNVHQCGDPTWTFWQDPAQWAKCLTQGGLTTVGLLAIGLLIGVVLIVVAERRPTPI